MYTVTTVAAFTGETDNFNKSISPLLSPLNGLPYTYVIFTGMARILLTSIILPPIYFSGERDDESDR